MERVRRIQFLAAALTIVGVAGLAFAAVALLSETQGAASDEPLLFSIGDVPAPVDWTATPEAVTALSSPDPLEQREAFVPSERGEFTPGQTPGKDAHDSGTPATRQSDAGASREGVRTISDIAFEPMSLRIPKIGVEARVVPVGTTNSGAMEAPRRYSEVGWWSPGAHPGEAGRAVFAGHVDSPWGMAVFFNLDDLAPGDEILVSDGSSELRYVVRGAAVYRSDAAPVEDIFGPSIERELVLITCGGWFDRQTASYLHRRVVFAVLAPASGEAPVSDESR